MIVSRKEGKEEGQLSFPFLLGGGGRVLEWGERMGGPTSACYFVRCRQHSLSYK